MTPEALLYNMALAASLKKEAVSSLLLGGLGRALAGFPARQNLDNRIAQFHQRAQSLHPHDVGGAKQLLDEYNDLPHGAYAGMVGAKPHGLIRQIAPGLVTGPALAMQGAAMGSAFGPMGTAAGAMLGGVGSHILNRAHIRGLNKSVGPQL